MNTMSKNRRTHSKCLWALLLCVIMMVGLMPTTAYAADTATIANEGSETPAKPTIEELGPTLKVICVDGVDEHGQIEYSPIAGAYTISDVTKGGDDYTCTFTIDPNAYVTRYNEEKGTQHTVLPGIATSIDYVYRNGQWTSEMQDFLWIPSTCKMTISNAEELNPTVKVLCANESAEHNEKTYSLIAGTYTLGALAGDADGYTCTLTINTAEYVSRYNTDLDVTHTTQTEDVSVVYTWEDNAWTAKTGNTAEIKVVCEDTTATPVNPPTGDDNEPADSTQNGTDNGKEDNTTSETISPNTGDNSHIGLCVVLLFISGGTVITLTVVDRKRKAVKR